VVVVDFVNRKKGPPTKGPRQRAPDKGPPTGPG